MIFDCNCINDNGEEVDEDGNIVEKSEYPYRYYQDERGEELTYTEYKLKSIEQRAKYEKFLKLDLKSNSGNDVKWITQYDFAIIRGLIEKILPTEPPAVLKLYRKALENKNATSILDDYRDVIEACLERRLWD